MLTPLTCARPIPGIRQSARGGRASTETLGRLRAGPRPGFNDALRGEIGVRVLLAPPTAPASIGPG